MTQVYGIPWLISEPAKAVTEGLKDGTPIWIATSLFHF